MSPGATLFKDKGCFGCHTLNGTGGTLGPDLTHAGARLDRGTLAKILQDPKSVNPKAIMPAPGLSGDELDRLVDFLGGLQ